MNSFSKSTPMPMFSLPLLLPKVTFFGFASARMTLAALTSINFRMGISDSTRAGGFKSGS